MSDAHACARQPTASGRAQERPRPSGIGSGAGMDSQHRVEHVSTAAAGGASRRRIAGPRLAGSPGETAVRSEAVKRRSRAQPPRTNDDAPVWPSIPVPPDRSRRSKPPVQFGIHHRTPASTIRVRIVFASTRGLHGRQDRSSRTAATRRQAEQLRLALRARFKGRSSARHQRPKRTGPPGACKHPPLTGPR
jgi:hypothetical protein